LIGAALAMVLVGPYAATSALTVVLIVQALLFADGGLTALGLSIFNMGVISVWISFLTFILLKKLLPKTKASIVAASFLAAFVSVPAAALSFVFQYAIGATGTFSISAVLSAMVGTHILIGIGEGIITALTVSAVLASRSDLVYGWDSKNTPLEIRT
jgi:cobalamin biosynthesis protein CbiM